MARNRQFPSPSCSLISSPRSFFKTSRNRISSAAELTLFLLLLPLPLIAQEIFDKFVPRSDPAAAAILGTSRLLRGMDAFLGMEAIQSWLSYLFCVTPPLSDGDPSRRLMTKLEDELGEL